MNKSKLSCQQQLDFLLSFSSSFAKYISCLDSPSPIDDNLLALLKLTQDNQSSELLSFSNSIRYKIFHDIFVNGFDPELTLNLYRCSVREYTSIIKEFLPLANFDF